MHNPKNEVTFETHWQPIVNLVTGTTIAYEALGRIDGRDQVDQILAAMPRRAATYDRALRDCALRTVPLLPANTKLFVNISAAGIQHAASINGKTLRLPGAPDRIVWELTESPGWTLSRDTSLRVFGEVALDDIGVGHADLFRLFSVRPHWLKIAMPLVAGCASNPEKRPTLQALVMIAQAHQINVIAEGVECSEDAEVLRNLGVSFAQGYLFGRPAPPAHWIG